MIARMLPSVPLLGNCSFSYTGKRIWKFLNIMSTQWKRWPDLCNIVLLMCTMRSTDIDTDIYIGLQGSYKCVDK